MRQKMNLRQAADYLGIEPWKVLHLGRFLGVNAYEYMIPSDEVENWTALDDLNARYSTVREWLLNHPQAAVPVQRE